MNWYKKAQQNTYGLFSNHELTPEAVSHMDDLLGDMSVDLPDDWVRQNLIPYGLRVREWQLRYRDAGSGDTEVREALADAFEKVLYTDHDREIPDWGDDSEAYHLYNADFYMIGPHDREYGYAAYTPPNYMPSVSMDEFEEEL